MKKFGIFAVTALLSTALIMMPEMAMANASEAGSTLKDDVFGLVTGSMGTMVGLIIALLGLYTWIVKQETWGIIIIIGGVALTAFPGLFDSLRGSFVQVFEDGTNSSPKFSKTTAINGPR